MTIRKPLIAAINAAAAAGPGLREGVDSYLEKRPPAHHARPLGR